MKKLILILFLIVACSEDNVTEDTTQDDQDCRCGEITQIDVSEPNPNLPSFRWYDYTIENYCSGNLRGLSKNTSDDASFISSNKVGDEWCDSNFW